MKIVELPAELITKVFNSITKYPLQWLAWYVFIFVMLILLLPTSSR